MSYHDIPYLNLLTNIRDLGSDKGDRTGTGTRSLFAQQMRFDLSDGTVPLLTSKKMFTRGIAVELEWFLTGDTNIKYLQDRNVHIWDEWADDDGNLGPIYGEQWRNWPDLRIANSEEEIQSYRDRGYSFVGFIKDSSEGVHSLIKEDVAVKPKRAVMRRTIDQIQQVVEILKINPNCRRIIVSAWNVSFIEEMSLPPCHCLFQFWVDGEGRLSMHLYQRSCDSAIGIPFNIAQYAMLLHIIAQVTGLKVGEFIWTGGDVHIYNNHFDGVAKQLKNEPYPSPKIELNPDLKNINDFKAEDIKIIDYKSHDKIGFTIAV